MREPLRLMLQITGVRPPCFPDGFQDPNERQNRKNSFDGLIMGCSGLARSIY
jgi:hypothetical protein